MFMSMVTIIMFGTSMPLMAKFFLPTSQDKEVEKFITQLKKEEEL
jgi:hypothetical protein